jgi:hypothetical protein
MSRIPRADTSDLSHDAAALLAAAAPSRAEPLNLHAEMAYAPVVLSAYMGIRNAIEAYGSLDPKTHTAIMLTVSAAQACEYAQAVQTHLLQRAGWGDDAIATIRTLGAPDDPALDALLALVREAVSADGRVADTTWRSATAAGWSVHQLGDAFVSMSLAVFTDQFLAFADTTLDVPAAPPVETPAA